MVWWEWLITGLFAGFVMFIVFLYCCYKLVSHKPELVSRVLIQHTLKNRHWSGV